MQQVEFKALNIREIACPKCGTIGRLTHFGKDYRKKYHRVYCTSCTKTSSELQLRILLKGTPEEIKPEPAKGAFNWNDYSEERQIKIQQLIGILREHPDWGAYKLQKELQQLNMGISKQEIIKVKNAFREGGFNA